MLDLKPVPREGKGTPLRMELGDSGPQHLGWTLQGRQSGLSRKETGTREQGRHRAKHYRAHGLGNHGSPGVSIPGKRNEEDACKTQEPHIL